MSEKPPLLGEIIDDPKEQMFDGSVAKFCPTRFLPQPHLRRSVLQDWEYFDGALLALHFGSSHSQSVLGSAVLVAPGIALCARHVVEPFVQQIQSRAIDIICSAISKSGVMFWRVREVALTRQTDVAILTLCFAARVPKDSEFTLAAISTRLPRVGEMMTIVGFVASEDEFRSTPTEPISIGGNVCVATGNVTQQFELKVDGYLLPWPTIELDCASLGGMSGGPAFDRYGMLVGVVCSGLHTQDGNGPAFVSLIWPALVIGVRPVWPPRYYERPVSLLEIDQTICHIDGREAVSLEYDQASGLPKVLYKRW